MQYILFPLLFALLYRMGGAVWKPARRYGIPILGLVLMNFSLTALVFMSILCLILHFNLNEIGERDWDDVACYGFAQAFCLSFSGLWAILVGAWWFIGTYCSNNDTPILKRLNWKYVELGQGAMIGLCIALRNS